MSKHISLASYELETAARAEGYAHCLLYTSPSPRDS